MNYCPAANLDVQQLILTGGVSLLILIALGVVLYRKGWPLVLDRLRRQDKVTDDYKQALSESIATTHKVLAEQAEHERLQRKAELLIFTEELKQQRKDFLQTNTEQRKEFLDTLRDIRAEQRRHLQAKGEK